MAAKITTIEHLRDLATTVEGFTANLVGEVAGTAAEAIEAVEGTAANAENTAAAARANVENLQNTLNELGLSVNALKTDLSRLDSTALKAATRKNILFPPKKITEGKYLNPNTGNYGTDDSFMVVEDYYPVSPQTSYVGSTYFLTDHNKFGGAWAGYVCFYDSAKNFLSGVTVPTKTGVFDTPENCVFIRISNETHVYEQYVWQIEKGNSFEGATYEAYCPYVIVDVNGFGDYQSINEAVQAVADGDTIYIMPGTYIEQVKAWEKTVHLIGASKENCILKDTSGNYSAPPLKISSGSVENMTIIEDCPDLSAITDSMGANAIHIDSDYSSDKRLCIRNCIIKSSVASAVGIGLRKGFDLVFEHCFIVCSGAFNSPEAGPIYFHDADQPSYYGVSNVTIRNCVLKNTSSELYSMLTINSIHAENTTYMNFNHNIFTHKTDASTMKFNTWNTDGGAYDGFNGLRNMYLTEECYGNNVSELNAPV